MRILILCVSMALVLATAFAGLILFLARSHFPTPTEIGDLGPLVALAGSVVMVGSAYLVGWARIAARWARGEEPQ